MTSVSVIGSVGVGVVIVTAGGDLLAVLLLLVVVVVLRSPTTEQLLHMNVRNDNVIYRLIWLTVDYRLISIDVIL